MMLTISPEILVHRTLGAFLLPPLCFIWLALLGLWLKRRWLVLVALLLCYALSTPAMALWLTAPLENYPVITPARLAQVDAIVVLGGGSHPSPEYGGADVGVDSLLRVRYAATLARQSGKPILVSGGPAFAQRADALQMARVLRRDYGLQARWIESASATTQENARFSAQILLPAGMKRIALVSNAWHLRRAVPFFSAQGFSVTPAPTGFIRFDADADLLYLPTGDAMAQSWVALREWLGILFYSLPLH